MCSARDCLGYYFLFLFGDFVFFAILEAFFGADFFFGDAFTFTEDFFPFGDDVLAGALLPFADDFGADFPFREEVFGFTFSSFTRSTNFSTVQPTLMETTSSPGFTSTITSPLVAARLRMPASSNRVDFGAPLV